MIYDEVKVCYLKRDSKVVHAGHGITFNMIVTVFSADEYAIVRIVNAGSPDYI